MKTQGPNVKRLIVHRMSQLMVPPGAGIGDALAAMVKPGNISAVAREATAWVEAALAAVRSAPGNPYADDEEIAGAILAGIERKRAVVSKVFQPAAHGEDAGD
jgi:hypothetical protein